MSKYAKALVGAVVTALTTVQVAMDSGHPVNLTQWTTLGIGVLVTVLGVWAVPNTSVTIAVPTPFATLTDPPVPTTPTMPPAVGP